MTVRATCVACLFRSEMILMHSRQRQRGISSIFAARSGVGFGPKTRACHCSWFVRGLTAARQLFELQLHPVAVLKASGWCTEIPIMTGICVLPGSALSAHQDGVARDTGCCFGRPPNPSLPWGLNGGSRPFPICVAINASAPQLDFRMSATRIRQARAHARSPLRVGRRSRGRKPAG
jgi:hypothetical protein